MRKDRSAGKRHPKNLSPLSAEEYFEERARRANPAKVSRILARLGKGNTPMEGDELPPNLSDRKRKKKRA